MLYKSVLCHSYSLIITEFSDTISLGNIGNPGANDIPLFW